MGFWDIVQDRIWETVGVVNEDATRKRGIDAPNLLVPLRVNSDSLKICRSSPRRRRKASRLCTGSRSLASRPAPSLNAPRWEKRWVYRFQPFAQVKSKCAAPKKGGKRYVLLSSLVFNGKNVQLRLAEKKRDVRPDEQLASITYTEPGRVE